MKLCLSPLGAGGMGEVIPAELAGHPDRMARFEREARPLVSLDHPNIGAIYGQKATALGRWYWR